MIEGGFYRRLAGGIEMRVRLTPKSARDAVEGVAVAADGRAHLKARVRAVPEKGKANQALIRLMATTLGVPAGDVRLAAGDTARLKTLRVAGEPAEIEARLQQVVLKSEPASRS